MLSPSYETPPMSPKEYRYPESQHKTVPFQCPSCRAKESTSCNEDTFEPIKPNNQCGIWHMYICNNIYSLVTQQKSGHLLISCTNAKFYQQSRGILKFVLGKDNQSCLWKSEKGSTSLFDQLNINIIFGHICQQKLPQKDRVPDKAE